MASEQCIVKFTGLTEEEEYILPLHHVLSIGLMLNEYNFQPKQNRNGPIKLTLKVPPFCGEVQNEFPLFYFSPETFCLVAKTLLIGSCPEFENALYGPEPSQEDVLLAKVTLPIEIVNVLIYLHAVKHFDKFTGILKRHGFEAYARIKALYLLKFFGESDCPAYLYLRDDCRLVYGIKLSKLECRVPSSSFAQFENKFFHVMLKHGMHMHRSLGSLAPFVGPNPKDDCAHCREQIEYKDRLTELSQTYTCPFKYVPCCDLAIAHFQCFLKLQQNPTLIWVCFCNKVLRGWTVMGHVSKRS